MSKKFGKSVGLLFLVMAAGTANAESLENQLEALKIPENRPPAAVEQEKLYAVQSRYSPLKSRFETTLGLGHNFTSHSLVNSNQVDFGMRYHLSDRFSVLLGAGFVSNSLNATGTTLLENFNALPDSPYLKYRADLQLVFNTFYGKFRLSMNEVLYFDQYVSAGPSLLFLSYGRETAGMVDIGFAFWLGKWGSVRLGAMNYLYTEQRASVRSFSHHMVGHLDLGFLWGGSGT